MHRCADPQLRPEGTWISPAMLAAYTKLHELGIAHSVETWRDGVLAGGLYGVALGKAFFGESMFSAERDASKVALHALVQLLLAGNAEVIDCQVATGHLLSLGARLIPRREFTTLLERCVGAVAPTGSWRGRESEKYGK